MLKKKFSTGNKETARQKRFADRFAVSLDAANTDDETCSLMDFIPSDFDTFEEVTKRQETDSTGTRYNSMFPNYPHVRLNILNLLIDGYKPNEIRQIGNITKKYEDKLYT